MKKIKKLALIATIFILLALLSALASPTLVMASPYRILNPSFETPDTAPSIANWTYSSTDTDYAGAQSTAWVKEGTYSYLFSVSAATISSGTYGQILQSSVNFAPIDRISFDANLYASAAKFEARLIVGAATVWYEIPPATAADYLHVEVDLSSYDTSQNLIFQIYATAQAPSATVTCYFDNIRIWGSYSDEVARTTVSNTFSTYGETVYMYGESIAVAVGTYKVAYYDGGTAHDGTNGAKVGTDVVFTFATEGELPTDGVLESQIRPADYGASSYGTWHAVIYNTTESMPASYNLVSKTDAAYIITDSFTVEAACIPEFSTVFAAIAVVGLCFGIYYWMRRRVRGVH